MPWTPGPGPLPWTPGPFTQTPHPHFVFVCVHEMALRFNDKDAVYLSKNTRLRTERAGVLLKRGETNTAFKQRYFVLKANLLFYFKAANVHMRAHDRG